MNSIVFRVAFSILKLVAPKGDRIGSTFEPRLTKTLSFGDCIREHDLVPFAEIVGSLSCQFLVSIFLIKCFLFLGW